MIVIWRGWHHRMHWGDWQNVLVVAVTTRTLSHHIVWLLQGLRQCLMMIALFSFLRFRSYHQIRMLQHRTLQRLSSNYWFLERLIWGYLKWYLLTHILRFPMSWQLLLLIDIGRVGKNQLVLLFQEAPILLRGVLLLIRDWTGRVWWWGQLVEVRVIAHHHLVWSTRKDDWILSSKSLPQLIWWVCPVWYELLLRIVWGLRWDTVS